MFFISSRIVSSFGPGMQNHNGSRNNENIKAIAISHEKPLNFDTAARLYFVAEGGLESSHDAQTAGLIRFAIRSILPGVTVPPMTANRYAFPPILVPQSRRDVHSVNNLRGIQIPNSV